MLCWIQSSQTMGRQLYSYILTYEENEYELEIIRIFF